MPLSDSRMAADASTASVIMHAPVSRQSARADRRALSAGADGALV
jgi:hypothetical protein